MHWSKGEVEKQPDCSLQYHHYPSLYLLASTHARMSWHNDYIYTINDMHDAEG
jgi:hypothetical protein